MVKLKKWVFILSIILAIGVLYWYQLGGEKQNTRQLSLQLQKALVDQNNQSEKHQAGNPIENEDNPYLERDHSYFASSDAVVRYVFASAMTGNIELFFANYDPKIFISSIKDKTKVNEELKSFLKLLNQDGNLKEIGIVNKKVIESNPQLMRIQYETNLFYGKLKRKSLIFELSQTQDAHEEVQWLITTPIDELRNQLNR